MSDVNLLPPNSTRTERALEQAMARIGEADVPIRHLWNPDTCPAHLLPWLAWAFSVDVWDSTAPEETKREIIRQSVEVHRRKGTVGAVKRALAAAGAPAEIVEWWQDGAAAHTFKVRVDVARLIARGKTFNAALVAGIADGVDATKPVRSHYSILAFFGIEAEVYAGAFLSAGARIEVHPLVPTSVELIATIPVAAVLAANARIEIQ
jgi:phage tail P2-like protein